MLRGSLCQDLSFGNLPSGGESPRGPQSRFAWFLAWVKNGEPNAKKGASHHPGLQGTHRLRRDRDRDPECRGRRMAATWWFRPLGRPLGRPRHFCGHVRTRSSGVTATLKSRERSPSSSTSFHPKTSGEPQIRQANPQPSVPAGQWAFTVELRDSNSRPLLRG